MTLKKYFGDRKFYRGFFAIAFPVMLSTLITSVVNFADNLMVGLYSNVAVSAVFSANQVTFVFNILMFGVVGGAGIFIQQFYGAGDRAGLRQAFHYKILAVAVLLVLGLPLLYIFGRDLIDLFSKSDVQSAEILEASWQYMSIVLFSFIPFGFMVVFSTTLRETGHTRPPVYGAVLSLVVNVALNALLITGPGPFPALGVVGAAYATLAARIVELLTLVIYSFWKKYGFCSHFWDFRIDRSLLGRITLKSLPIIVNEFLWSLAMTMYTLAYSKRGDVLSALSIAATTSEVFTIVFNGFGSGIGVMVGHRLGEGKISEAKSNAGKLLFLSGIFGLGFTVLLAAFSPVIPLFYREVTANQKEIATYLILSYASCVVFFALNSSIFTTLKAGGSAVQAFLMDSFFSWVLPVPLAFLLVGLTDLPLPLIYLSVQLTDAVKLCFAQYFYRRGRWAVNLAQHVQLPTA